MRALLLFLIGLAFGAAGGFLGAGGLGEGHAHDHAGHSDMNHEMSGLTAWDGEPPTLDLLLSPDMGSDVNLEIAVNGFTFMPETVNTAPVQGTGHAHVYVDGVKVARAYGRWMHLTDVPEGAVIRVTLNANDHSGWGIDDMPIAAEVINQ